MGEEHTPHLTPSLSLSISELCSHLYYRTHQVPLCFLACWPISPTSQTNSLREGASTASEPVRGLHKRGWPELTYGFKIRCVCLLFFWAVFSLTILQDLPKLPPFGLKALKMVAGIKKTYTLNLYQQKPQHPWSLWCFAGYGPLKVQSNNLSWRDHGYREGKGGERKHAELFGRGVLNRI